MVMTTVKTDNIKKYQIHDKPAEPKKKIGAGTFVGTYGASLFIQACTLVQAIIIARLLGPQGRGEYAAVILWPSLFSAVGIFGTNIALARAAAQTIHYDQVIRTSIILAMITASISGIACYLSLPYLLPNVDLVRLSRVFILFIIIDHLALNLIAVDQGVGNFKRINFTKAIFSPLYILFLFGMWSIGNQGVELAAIGMLFAYMVVVLVRLILALKDMNILGSMHSPLKIIHESARFGLVGATQPLYQYADKAVILWLLGTENLGFYTAALSASAAISSITYSAGFVSFTMTAQEEQGKGFKKVAKVFRISAVLWFIFGSMLLLAMPILLPMVYGKEFEPAINAAKLLIFGSAFGGLANLLDQAMRGQGRAFVGLEGRVLGILVMIMTGIILSHWLGLPGMCIAFILGQFTCLSFFIWRILKHYNEDVKQIMSFVSVKDDIVSMFNHFK